jgi:hypothetical protein
MFKLKPNAVLTGSILDDMYRFDLAKHTDGENLTSRPVASSKRMPAAENDEKAGGYNEAVMVLALSFAYRWL